MRTTALSMLLACAGLSGCRDGQAAPPPSGSEIDARRAADMIHAALAADRATYTREVVNRLTKVHKVQVVDPEAQTVGPLEAREDWKSEHGKLPLPAQMFRMGAEAVLEGDTGLSALLLSEWPINRQNAAKTDAERVGLTQVGRDRRAFYDSEILDGKRYFVAVYPDVATVEACVSCHNDHPDSPRKDFAVGDVMGAMVVRFPL